MKWIGQNIYDFISRFRSDVYLEDISTGTIASGAHLGLDSNNKIVKAVDGGGDLTSIVAGTGLTGSSLTSGDATLNVIGGTGITANANDIALTNGLIADGSNITSVGTIGTGVWQGTTIKTAYIGDDQVTEDKLANTLLAEIDANTAKNSAPNIFGEYIKLLISDFATNKDGGNTKHGIGFDETVTDVNGDAYDQAYGIKVPNNATELYAFVSIPRGKTATHVEVFDRGDNLAFEVFEVQINAATMVSKGTGNCNTINNIDDVVATETNQLAIKVTTVSVNNRVWGGRVTIA